jgi:hypothetical protein
MPKQSEICDSNTYMFLALTSGRLAHSNNQKMLSQVFARGSVALARRAAPLTTRCISVLSRHQTGQHGRSLHTRSHSAFQHATTSVSSSPSIAVLPEPSYSSGTSDVPLLGDTIGVYFDRMVAKHGNALALVCHCSKNMFFRRNSSSNQLSAIALFFAGGITAEYLVDVGRARRSR